MFYELISWENEPLIKSNDLKEVREKFLSYVKDTKNEYVVNGDKTEEEVEEEVNDMRESIKEEVFFNDTLNDYGFEPLIKRVA
ncbi:hypothetical protein [Poseidonibacter ostreae]|uniref:Uncharacterized protein n=1 Tax=Poseidonibacter ostreae TaxID=2654171 RepID=A0A6L4WZJ3_9BACT|nr:hypothetical protein [Poseidonibacter ostreae]KAB7891404.1 hypothetical protein GBG19_00780 [Poseidonibacter ostreae]